MNMIANNDKVLQMKLKLKTVTKHKLSIETTVNNLRALERTVLEKLTTTRDEIIFLSENLSESRKFISETHHQISMVEICKASEKAKVESQIFNLNTHKQAFENLFRHVKESAENLQREAQKKEMEMQEIKRQKKNDLAERNEIQLNETLALEADTEKIEKECAILKKRNAAIMTKLRRKLLQTEDSRRELMKKVSTSFQENPI